MIKVMVELQAIQDWLRTSGTRILLIIVVSLLAYRLLQVISQRLQKVVHGEGDFAAGEREQRAKTLADILEGTGLVFIVLIAGMMVLRELGLDITPLVAGAGIVGLAVGFGSQTLVRDVISGFFILLENQFAVGDVVEVKGITGEVERVSLRTTILRDLEGTVHIIPNGEIRLLSNLTKGWSRAIVDVGVSRQQEVDRVLSILERIGQELWKDEKYSLLILEEPAVVGPEELGGAAMKVRIMAKTLPGKQWDVSREMRRRINETFEREGIEMR